MSAISRLCRCTPSAVVVTPSGGSLVHTCTTCGAEAIELSGNMPAFVRDSTVYRVSIALSSGLLKTHLGLIKKKSGRTTPELLDLARRGEHLVLFEDRAISIHYELRELANAGCAVRVEPPYPHDVAR
ncbi:MAG: hypothetical protein ABIY55_01750 [Kofleriaceae bacterium]